MNSAGLCLVISVCFAVFIGTGAQQCPEDWIKHGASCYVFVDDFLSWAAAKAVCDTLDGKMLEVETAEENAFVVAQMKLRPGMQSAWLGLNDFVREGRYVWRSNREVAKFTNWAAGQPDNNDNHANGEDCVQVQADGTWNDLWCEDFLSDAANKPSPVCEIELTEEEIIG